MTAPVVVGPAQVPDLRLWLIDQWRDSGAFKRAARVERGAAQGSNYGDAERHTLASAGLWWVSEDMVDLLMAAVPSVPDDVTLDHLHRPAPAGLVVFAKPWFGIDGRRPDERVQVDALTWGGAVLPPVARPTVAPDGQLHDGRAGHRVLSVASYRRVDYDQGLSAEQLQYAMEHDLIRQARVEDEPTEGKTTADVVPMPDNHRVTGLAGHDEHGRIVRSMRLHGQAWAPLGRSDWPLDDALGDWSFGPGPFIDHAGQAVEPGPQMIASATEDRRVVAALWTLLHQDGIAATTTHVVPRQQRRHAERKGVTDPKGSAVQVVTLRKLHRTRPDGEPEHDGRHYSHRWVVNGHWRNAAVGPGRTQRRLTWVTPHIKGPDDAPLLTKQRVNAWVR